MRLTPRIRRAGLAVMAALAVLKIGSELFRLTLESSRFGAIDLRLRYDEVARWFAGVDVYGVVPQIAYPPATYPLLWPLLGWLSFEAARWIWAATSLLALAWLVRIFLRAGAPASRNARAFLVLLVLSMNAVGVTIGNGQLVLHLLPPLLAAVLLRAGREAAWSRDLAAAALVVVALAKPTITGPFLWIVLFSPGGWRPMTLVVTGYIGLTWLASAFQSAPMTSLLEAWIAQSRPGSTGGYGDVQTALIHLGFPSATMSASLAVLTLHGIWAWRHRRADLWIQLGVAALVARFWAYHRVYDDVLVLIPMLTLFRIAQDVSMPSRLVATARTMLAAAVVAMLLPARLETSPWPWPWMFVGLHVTAWGAMLVVLVSAASARSQWRLGWQAGRVPGSR